MPPSINDASAVRGRRAVLALSAIAGLAVPLYFLGIADVSHFAWDFRAYYAAAESVLAGRPFVGLDAGPPGVAYVYPPVAVTLFLPQAAVGGLRVAFLLQTAFNLACALALAALAVRTVEARRGRLPTIDRAVIGGFCLLSAPALAVLGQGQVDMLIACAIAGAFLALERDREAFAGAALAGAALVKVFPAVLGLWLVRRRAWRAVGTAVLTGVVGLALGALAFGIDAYRQYLTVLAARSRLAEFAGTVSPDFFAMSLHRPLSQLLPGVDPGLYVPLSGLVLLPALALVARRERGFAGRLRTYLVAVAAMLLVSPASNALYVVYVYLPVVCLLYLDTSGGQLLPLAGTAAIAFPVQPAQIAAVLAAVGVPAPVGAPVVSAAYGALTVASVPLLGLLALIVWCVRREARPTEHPAGEVRPAGAD